MITPFTSITLAALLAFPGAEPLTIPHDLDSIASQHVEQVIGYFRQRIGEARKLRDSRWRPDFASHQAYGESLASHRSNCRAMLGLVDFRGLADAESELVAQSDGLRIERITIEMFSGLSARGLLFSPTADGRHPVVIVHADATEWPEGFAGLGGDGPRPAWLGSLLARGAIVYLPQSIERLEDHPYCKTTANKDRRMILYRLGYCVGRTMPGLDVQETLAAVDYLAKKRDHVDPAAVGLVGVGQGGMTALFAAALDPRIRATAVIDYFETHDRCSNEPVDRRLPARLLEFGDAELAALIAPRRLFIVRSPGSPTSQESVAHEARRAGRFYHGLKAPGQLTLLPRVADGDALLAAASAVGDALALPEARGSATQAAVRIGEDRAKAVRDEHFEERIKYLRDLIDRSEAKREERWSLTTRPPSDFKDTQSAMLVDYRKLVGSVSTEGTPLRPRMELALEADRYKAYRVMLDVTGGVELYGNLLVPTNVSGRMPAVIAQHGLSGTPEMLTGLGQKADTAYHEFGRHLAEHGYVVFAPFIMHRHPIARINQQARLADAVGMMRVAMAVAKTERAIDFLQTLPSVDSERIGYYGLSYGGYSALWIAPLVERLTVIVPSGHFNDWRSKITADYIATSYLRHPDEDFYNWDVLHRFTHVELVTMTAPRPVCIEFGQRDGITTPEWTAYAWGQLKAVRDHLGLTERIELAHYDGVHEIHGVETFDFLDRFLRPERAVGRDGDSLVEHVLDQAPESQIRGRFWIPRGAKELHGMDVKLSHVGRPGSLQVRFGSGPGKDDLGTLELSPDAVPDSPSPEKWCTLAIEPQAVRPGQMVYFEMLSTRGAAPENHYVFQGPRPLGGKHWGNGFGLCYRVLTEAGGLSAVSRFRARAIRAENATTSRPTPKTPAGSRKSHAVPVRAANQGQ